MSRINVYTRPDDYDMEPHPKLAGWFDSDKAEWIREDTYWNGNSRLGVISGLECGYEGLYRTANGRWVRYYNARNQFNGPEFYEFLTDEQAREWLLRNSSDDLVEKYFGEVEEERGPGRPEIGGPAINLRFPQDMLDRIDAAAKTDGISRAEKIRRLCAAGL